MTDGRHSGDDRSGQPDEQPTTGQPAAEQLPAERPAEHIRDMPTEGKEALLAKHLAGNNAPRTPTYGTFSRTSRTPVYTLRARYALNGYALRARPYKTKHELWKQKEHWR